LAAGTCFNASAEALMMKSLTEILSFSRLALIS